MVDERAGAGEVWISSWRSDYRIGNKCGVRTKYRGRDWDSAKFILDMPPAYAQKAFDKVNFGITLDRDDFPEAGAVWNEKAFLRKGDLFYVGLFAAVKGKMLEVLSQFDLGEGGLVDIPMFKADLETPWPERCCWINFGSAKTCFVAKESSQTRIHSLGENPELEQERWNIRGNAEDFSIAVSEAALKGADLWTEGQLVEEIFMSGRLAHALKLAKPKTAGSLRLHQARIVESGL